MSFFHSATCLIVSLTADLPSLPLLLAEITDPTHNQRIPFVAARDQVNSFDKVNVWPYSSAIYSKQAVFN